MKDCVLSSMRIVCSSTLRRVFHTQLAGKEKVGLSGDDVVRRERASWVNRRQLFPYWIMEGLPVIRELAVETLIHIALIRPR
jgi:hypothetical protein